MAERSSSRCPTCSAAAFESRPVLSADYTDYADPETGAVGRSTSVSVPARVELQSPSNPTLNSNLTGREGGPCPRPSLNATQVQAPSCLGERLVEVERLILLVDGFQG
jgi:hypothetical protein